MRVLAWDTSSPSGILVALEWDSTAPQGTNPESKSIHWAAELEMNVVATHSERLLLGIHQTLEAARWKLEDVDIFGVGLGPGSFTGLRIGITTARTLAHLNQKPVVGISSLAALARPAARAACSEQDSSTLLLAVTDACKGELFALWGPAEKIANCAIASEGSQEGLWVPEVTEQVIQPQHLVDELIQDLQQKGPRAHWAIVGTGRLRYPEVWEKLPREKERNISLPNTDQIQARSLGLLVWEAVQRNLARDALEIYPRYLRSSDAEIKLRAGLLPRSVPPTLVKASE